MIIFKELKDFAKISSDELIPDLLKSEVGNRLRTFDSVGGIRDYLTASSSVILIQNPEKLLTIGEGLERDIWPFKKTGKDFLDNSDVWTFRIHKANNDICISLSYVGIVINRITNVVAVIFDLDSIKPVYGKIYNVLIDNIIEEESIVSESQCPTRMCWHRCRESILALATPLSQERILASIQKTNEWMK